MRVFARTQDRHGDALIAGVIFGRSRRGLRRLGLSRLLLVVGIALALGTMFWLTQAVQTRGQLQVDAQGQRTAEVIATAVVRPRLGADVMAAGRFTTDDLVDLWRDVGHLRSEGQLLGVGVWTLDGTALFAGQTPGADELTLSEGDLERAQAGEPWMTHGRGADGQSELCVFLPSAAAADESSSAGSVVEVVLPHEDLAAEMEQRQLQKQTVIVIIFALVILGMVLLRRRLVRRERQARHDSLTGLLNRRALYEDAGGLLAVATAKRPVALLLLDLSEFKSVNDTLGHAAGDQLLQQVGGVLKAAVRPDDIVVRLGGDEFAVVLTHLRDSAAARSWADKLQRELRAVPFTVCDVEVAVDASVGVALAPEHGRAVPQLLQRADVAMYQAKLTGSGTAVYDPITDEHSVGQLAMATDLRRALDNEEFELHYQPKVSMPDRRVAGVEALLRWRHPTRGLLLPGEFLAVLERSGLMQPVTRWVLRQAIQQAANWRRAGMPLQVAVNLSPRSFLDNDLPARVLASLSAADLPASLLQLEITETAVMTNPERAVVVLSQLEARGVEVAIDDFGAGCTSLAFLRTLPVGALKLDRSMVCQMLDQGKDEPVTHAVIDLAHRLGLSVIAEGVESDALVDRLAALGCDQAQGFVISKPLPHAALEGWLTDWNARSASSQPVATP
jgi:diguanylate cyclase (GGDEF)-like protein